ncbi:hypothetical protein [uncultured Gammaproteobacteria bacterium]|nr:hypothetical protein [uncultured Gammaproteobacteria bacterium]
MGFRFFLKKFFKFNGLTMVLSFCSNSSTNLVLNAEVYFVRFLLIFLLPIFLFSLTRSK